MVFPALRIAAEGVDGKSQGLVFKCVQLIIDYLLVSISKSYMEHCVRCIGRFTSHVRDVNLRLVWIHFDLIFV